MASKPIKITFTLDETEAEFFRDLYRKAKRNAASQSAEEIVGEVRGLITRVRSSKKVPAIVSETMVTLETLILMLEDDDYNLPKAVAGDAIAALAYFANPADLIPDHLPGFGFLDDAVMIKFVEEEFKHEVWAYNKFRSFRDGAEQRPWTAIARQRLPQRLIEHRKQLRAEVEKRKSAETEKRKFLW